VPADWHRFISAVSNSGADDNAKRKAMIELLGLVADINVTQPDPNSPTLNAELSIGVTASMSGSDAMDGVATIRVDAPWKIEGQTSASFRLQGERASASSAWRIGLASTMKDADAVWQTSAIRIDVNLTLPTSTGAGNAQRVSLQMNHVVLPSINGWWIAGPFDGGPLSESLAKVFPPETAPFDADAKFKGRDGKEIGWRKRVREIHKGDNLTHEFFTDFDEFYGHRVHDAVMYAVTWIEAPADMDAVIAIGSDDGLVVWLNGEEVHRKDIGRAYTSKQDRVRVRLKKGVNELRLKVNQGGGDWAFAAHIEGADGQPLPGVRVRMDAGKSSPPVLAKSCNRGIAPGNPIGTQRRTGGRSARAISLYWRPDRACFSQQ
ncbi:MAG: hypothetical protein KDA33_04630, partial [Phycisphaerales bacterium]|nr:hypothetical protein [Phycisphaerales bacterium]